MLLRERGAVARCEARSQGRARRRVREAVHGVGVAQSRSSRRRLDVAPLEGVVKHLRLAHRSDPSVVQRQAAGEGNEGEARRPVGSRAAGANTSAEPRLSSIPKSADSRFTRGGRFGAGSGEHVAEAPRWKRRSRAEPRLSRPAGGRATHAPRFRRGSIRGRMRAWITDTHDAVTPDDFYIAYDPIQQADGSGKRPLQAIQPIRLPSSSTGRTRCTRRRTRTPSPCRSLCGERETRRSPSRSR